VFGEGRILKLSHYGEGAPLPAGTPLLVDFELAGQRFQLLNGTPAFPFTQAVSFSVRCRDQAEVDQFWSRLTDGGQEVQCGWLKDRYGLSWQIVPEAMWRYMDDPDPAKVQRVFAAMVQMVKIDVAALDRAAAGG